MKPLLLLAILLTAFQVGFAQEQYELSADSLPQEGVPKGEVKGPFPFASKIFPGTQRDYWVYVPAQYDASKPACLLVVQDGIGRANDWKLPTVMDNLIHKGEMPVTLGLFVMHGVVPGNSDKAQPRFNRSFEYDGLGDRYARFLIEELLPEVKQSYSISDDPNDRAIAGASSGAICAFNVAWERPDQFRRVLSTIGTYVGLRGANEFPVLVRKHEPKPIRVFLQDGSNDLNIYAGSWWVANQDMLSALKYAGYDVMHVWGEGGHNGKHGQAIMPDALRWLWRNYPEPIQAGHNPDARTPILIPGEGWQLVSEGHKFTEGPAISPTGELFFTDIPNNRIHKISVDGAVSLFAEDTGAANGLMFGPDGKLYACANAAKQIVRYDMSGNKETFIEGVESNDLVILADGSGYFTDPGHSKVWRFAKDGQKEIADEGIERPNGIIATPDQSFIIVADTRGQFTYSFLVGPEGQLLHKQQYGHLHLQDAVMQSGADGMTVDTDGRIYVTTAAGLQVLDQLGRVNVILSKPGPGWLSNATFGGPEMNVLYVTCGEKVYKRKLNAKGLRYTNGPITPPKPGL